MFLLGAQQRLCALLSCRLIAAVIYCSQRVIWESWVHSYYYYIGVNYEDDKSWGRFHVRQSRLLRVDSSLCMSE